MYVNYNNFVLHTNNDFTKVQWKEMLTKFPNFKAYGERYEEAISK